MIDFADFVACREDARVRMIYLSARAPDAGADYTALAEKFPAPPANVGLVYPNGFGGLTEKAFLQDFANGVPHS